MARRNASSTQRSERWVTSSPTWTVQPAPSWIPRGNPKGVRSNPPRVGAVSAYLKWLAAYNNLPEEAFLPGGSHYRAFTEEGMESPAVQAVVSPPPAPPVKVAEVAGQKAAAKVTRKAEKVVEVQKANAGDAVEAIRRNIETLNTQVFTTAGGKPWSKATAKQGRPPAEYTRLINELNVQLEAAKRLEGKVDVAGAVIAGAQKVTRTKKQQPADAVPVVVAAVQEATAAAEQAQEISDNVADKVQEAAQEQGVKVEIVESVPAPAPTVAEEVDEDEAAILAAIQAQYAVPAAPTVVEAPKMTAAEARRAALKAQAAKLLGNPRSRHRAGARRNGVDLTPAVEKSIKNLIRKAGATPDEVDEVYQMIADVAADATPAPGQDITAFGVAFLTKVKAQMQSLISLIRETPGSAEVAAEVVETTPPAPIIETPSGSAPAPIDPAASVRSTRPAAAPVSTENMSEKEIEAAITRLIDEVIDEMLAGETKANPRRR